MTPYAIFFVDPSSGERGIGGGVLLCQPVRVCQPGVLTLNEEGTISILVIWPRFGTENSQGLLSPEALFLEKIRLIWFTFLSDLKLKFRLNFGSPLD